MKTTCSWETSAFAYNTSWCHKPGQRVVCETGIHYVNVMLVVRWDKSLTFNLKYMIDRGLIKKGSKVDHWRSQCKGRIIVAHLLFIHSFKMGQAVYCLINSRRDRGGLVPPTFVASILQNILRLIPNLFVRSWYRALPYGKPDSSVGIVTELQVQNIFLFSITSRPALKTTQPPMQWVAEAVYPGVKRPGREGNNYHLLTRLRIVELYLHYPIRLQDIVFN
jgi:hypothetical protein